MKNESLSWLTQEEAGVLRKRYGLSEDNPDHDTNFDLPPPKCGGGNQGGAPSAMFCESPQR